MKRLAFLLLALAAWAPAQGLAVNGNPVGEGVAFSVANTSYAAAAPLAQAVGARFFYDAERELALFQMSGRVAALRVYAGAAQAAADRSAMRVEGREVAALGGVLQGGVVYVQVRALAAAFGGRVALIPETGTVAVFFPRVTLTAVTQPQLSQPQLSGDFDRIVLEFAGDVPVTVREEGSAVLFRFERARLGGRAERLAGTRFGDAAYYPAGEGVELRLDLGEGVSYEKLELPQAQGVQVIIDIFPSEIQEPARGARRVVLDPAPQPAAEDDAAGLELARRLASLLARQGIAVSLTRDAVTTLPIEARSARGIGADLFLSLSLSTLPAGRFNLYYLDEAASLESLGMAIRQNAEASLDAPATSETRRRLLVGLTSDLAFGQSAAASVAAALSGELEAGSVTGAPLYVLGGAAGRGLLLELSRESAQNAELADALAAAVVAILP